MNLPPKISLAAARVNARKTQEEVAETLGISKATIVSWESYKTTPSYENLQKLEHLYEYPLDFVRILP